MALRFSENIMVCVLDAVAVMMYWYLYFLGGCKLDSEMVAACLSHGQPCVGPAVRY